VVRCKRMLCGKPRDTCIRKLSRWISLSGCRGRLPAPSPLRTGHGSFDPSGSSLFQGIFHDTRFHNLISGVLLTSMATGMV
jgi:hypothetical protein